MALIIFENFVDLASQPNPMEGAFLVGYNTATGVLSQKDHLGNITPIGGGGLPLNQTLAIGNFTGTSSILMTLGTRIRSESTEAFFAIDNGSLTPASLLQINVNNHQSFNVNNYILTVGDANMKLNATGNIFQVTSTSKIEQNPTNYRLMINSNYNLQIGDSTSTNTDKLNTIISSKNITIATGSNIVVAGANGHTAINRSNSLYTTNLVLNGDIFATSSRISFATNSVALVGQKNTHIAVNPFGYTSSGVSVFDVNPSTFTMSSTTYGTIALGALGTTFSANINNTVVLGNNINATQSNTVYLGSSKINVMNKYNLPLADGNSGQMVVTDGNGQLGWGDITSSFIRVSSGLTITQIHHRHVILNISNNNTFTISDSLLNNTEIMFDNKAGNLNIALSSGVSATGDVEGLTPPYRVPLNGQVWLYKVDNEIRLKGDFL